MTFLRKIAQWLLLPSLRYAAYRRGLTTGKKAAEQLCLTMYDKAKERCNSMHRQATQLAAERVQAGELEAKKIMANAYAAGYDEGVEIGTAKGFKEGEEAGKEHGYRQIAVEYGLFVPEKGVPPQPDMAGMRLALDVARPNIYDNGKEWIVRVVPEDIRYVKKFAYKDAKTKGHTLIQAIRYRNSLIPADDFRMELYHECVDHVTRDVPGLTPNSRAFHLGVCEEFHKRLRAHTGDLRDFVGWGGTDPGDRLELEDTAILQQPWPSLFDNSDNNKLNIAFVAAGLGGSYTRNVRQPGSYRTRNVRTSIPCRTVRDLLLVTGEELLAVSGFGPRSLDQLREGLAENGLVLWGEEPARRPSRAPGSGRAHRSIMID